MYGLLQAFAKWLESTPWGIGVRTSLWAYPFTQLIHFTGLSIWIGTNIALDLRLIGLGKKRETAAQLREDLFAWNWIGFCIVLLGGFLLFSSTATTFLVNIAFRWKLGVFVPLALLMAHLRAVESARLGSHGGNAGDCKICGPRGNFIVDLRDYCSC